MSHQSLSLQFHSFEMEIEEEIPITTEEEPSVEPKGYLARDEYTSERFKLELNNLPKYFGFGVSENKMSFVLQQIDV